MANLLLVKNTKWNESLVSDGQVAFIAQDTDEGKNILYAQGEYFGDSAKSNKVSIKEKITVAGGPLAESVAEVYPDGIPEGTTLQEILVSLLCKELFPSVIVTQPKASLKSGNITFNNVPSGFVEVGTISTIKATPSATTSSTTAAKISEMEYGYVKDGVKSTNKSITENVSVTLSGDYTFKMTSASFSDNAGTDIDDTITKTNSQISNCVVNTYAKTKIGSNTITATLNNIGGSFSVDTIEDVIPLSNLGNEGTTSYSTSYFSDEPLSTPANATSTKSWTGAYPIYIKGVEFDGTASKIDGIAVDSNTPLTKCTDLDTSIITYVKFPGQAASGWDIAIPNYYSSSTAVGDPYNTVSKEYSADARVTFTKTDKTGTFKCGTNNNTEFTYTIYKATGTNGANGVKLTINLK